jgi:hypothetical protein
MKVVLIERLDSHSGRCWQTVEELERAAEPLYCGSVGWLMSENKVCEEVVPHIAGGRNEKTIIQGCGDLAIRRSAIVKITVLWREANCLPLGLRLSERV